jgi:metallo-beta-lactamase family protein
VHLAGAGESLLFSGDLGRDDDLLMPPPAPAPGADVLLVESTYGNRSHPNEDVIPRLGAIVRDTIGRGGSVLLPAFAVGRTQALLLAVQRLKAAGEIPARLPVFVDSPMAIAATELYRRHARLMRIPARESRQLMDGVNAVETAQQSMRLARLRYPAIIISASGMATGGRVLHHLKRMAPDPRNHLVFAGFQVAGSRGARLVAGEPEVRIHGEQVPVRAQVSQLQGFSGHADAQGLLGWLRSLPRPPHQTFVVHGEPDAADTLRLRIQNELHWRVRVPEHGQRVTV